MKKFTTIIFDLDGTLLNTLDDLHAAVNYALRNNNLPERSFPDVQKFLGYGYLYLIKNCAPEGTPQSVIDATLKVFQDYYYKNSMNSTRPYDGMTQILEQLKQSGYKLAIVSNKGHAAVQELAKHFFNGIIEVAIGESADVRRKPAPDTAVAAMKMLKSSKEESLYVGDSEVDIETAHNAGMECLSVGWGFRTSEQLAQNGAKNIISNPSEILSFLGE